VRQLTAHFTPQPLVSLHSRSNPGSVKSNHSLIAPPAAGSLLSVTFSAEGVAERLQAVSSGSLAVPGAGCLSIASVDPLSRVAVCGNGMCETGEALVAADLLLTPQELLDLGTCCC
jgi:hypothetical protein